jgi:hypothetical protein
MDWRVAGIGLGCAGAIAAGAISWSYVERAPAGSQVPSFLTGALHEPGPLWPPAGASIAFHEETTALLTWGAQVSAAVREAARVYAMDDAPPPSAREQQRNQRRKQPKARPQPKQARPEPAPPPEVVEVNVRDRFGRIIQSRRVQRESYDGPRAYAPPQAYAPPSRRFFGPFGDW